MSKPFNPNTVETSVKDVTFVGLDDFQLMMVALHIKNKKRALLSVKSLQMIDSLYRYETTTEPLSGMAVSKLHAYFDKELVEMLLSKGAVLAGGMALSLADMDIETFRVGDGDFYILNEDKKLYMECAHAIEEMMKSRANIEKNVFRAGSCVLDFYADCWTHPVSLIYSNKKSAAELILAFDYGYVQCAVIGKETNSTTMEYELTKSCFAQECIEVKTNLYFRSGIIHDGVFEKRLKKIYCKNYKVSDDVSLICDFFPNKNTWNEFMKGRFYDYSTDPIDKCVNTREYIENGYIAKKILAQEKCAFLGLVNYTIDAQTVTITNTANRLIEFFDTINESDYLNLHLNSKKHVRFNRVGSPDEGWTLSFCPALHLIDKIIFNKLYLIQQLEPTTTYEKKRKFEDDE